MEARTEPARTLLLAAVLTASMSSGPVRADGIRVAVELAPGGFGLADLRVDGIGSGTVAVHTEEGPLQSSTAELKAVPGGAFVSSDSGDRLVELMGGVPTDIGNFIDRLIASLRGDPIPELRTVAITPVESETSDGGGTPFTPMSGLASRPRRDGPARDRGDRRENGPSRDKAKPQESKPGGREFKVLATAEGLIGGRTASGVIIKKYMLGSALPSRKGLNKKMKIVYLKNDRSITCKVLDVGPWNTNDPYWERRDGRPRAESGRDQFGRRTNGAGLDIFNGGWYELLGLRTYDQRLIESTSGKVRWQFAR